MLGLLINEREQDEMVYVLKRELEEMLMDLDDHRIDQSVKKSMIKRYQVIFNLFQRVASEQECMQYMLKESYVK
ncbi:MAG TPA: hypothetical protein VK125_07985 [Bacillota bacterium]|nr:hypothetical protein [Bacillota bacterium]